MESRSFRIKKIKSKILLFSPLALMVLALLFIGFGTFQNPLLSQFKMALKETVSPIVYAISSPFRWAKSGFTIVIDFVHTYQNNQLLLVENDNLKQWYFKSIQLEQEQAELKTLLNYVPPPKSETITAKALLDDGNYFVQSMILSAGKKHGVKKGFVAMTQNGVLGRIVEVGRKVSRLMLLTDHISRVPVVIGKDKVLGILAGDNSPAPKLISLPEHTTVSVGDLVLTSGQVGVFPSGLPIGLVESVQEGEITVRLFEKNQHPTFVRLVDFKLDNVLLDTDCEIKEQKE